MKRALIIALCAAVLTLLVPMILSFDVEKAGTAEKEETSVSEKETDGEKTAEEETAADQSELITIFEG
ncbi:MAG: hypothetical protein KH282_02600 [Clostridiales bacterium]|uniref:Uncharacterized protein n=1 Tax=Candidatus Scybalenecus merdavium TaxID=2840939 RepID=A0A9D1SNC1_9FIRM|nr:hypothetical protein [Clostridiales bacterium]HIU68733.1 hypothetical protein [Candidatus Scubalenecus merdavium]